MKNVNLLAVFAIIFGLAASTQLVLSATEYAVGDDAGWDTFTDYTTWLSDKTFYVGDTLVFNYVQGDHNVVIVGSKGYDNCVKDPNYGVLETGNDKVVLNVDGPWNFICDFHCDYSGQKIAIDVLQP